MPLKQVLSSLCILVIVVGCASTKEFNRQEYKGERLPLPAVIWVYNFASSSSEVPAESALSGQYTEHPTPQTAEDLAMGRELGDHLASYLVQNINDMGLTAKRAFHPTRPQVNDLVLKGYFLSVDEGSAAKRVVIGFGAGGSHLVTAVEGFQMTPNGLRKLGSGNVEAGASRTPGATLGVVGLIATANPAGLIVSGGMKAYGEYSGSATIEGRAKDTAEYIAEKLKAKFKEQGWIR